MMWLWFWKPTGKLTLRVLQVLGGKKKSLVTDEATSRVPVPLNPTIRAFLLSSLIWPELPRSLWSTHIFSTTLSTTAPHLSLYSQPAHLNRYFCSKAVSICEHSNHTWIQGKPRRLESLTEDGLCLPPTPNLSEAVCLPSGIATAISSSLPDAPSGKQLSCVHRAHHFSNQSLKWNKINKRQVWKMTNNTTYSEQSVASFYHSYTAVIKVRGNTCLCVCFHHLNDAHLDKTYCTVIAGVYTTQSYSHCSLCCLFTLFFFFFLHSHSVSLFIRSQQQCHVRRAWFSVGINLSCQERKHS